jgi:hypothetical protein
MAEATVLVCDTSGRPAVDTVSLKAGRLTRQKDVCQIHLDELFAGSRASRRGRRRVVQPVSAAPKRRGRPPGSKSKTPSRNGRRRRATT